MPTVTRTAVVFFRSSLRNVCLSHAHVPKPKFVRLLYPTIETIPSTPTIWLHAVAAAAFLSPRGIYTKFYTIRMIQVRASIIHISCSFFAGLKIRIIWRTSVVVLDPGTQVFPQKSFRSSASPLLPRQWMNILCVVCAWAKATLRCLPQFFAIFND